MVSRFVEYAVRRPVVQCIIQDIRERNADTDPDEVQSIVDEAARILSA